MSTTAQKSMIFNSTAGEIPPLPEFSLSPRPPLLPYMSDSSLSLLLPVLAYWIVSLFYHIIDVYDLFPQYRLHTPVEVLKRNHVSRWNVIKDVVIQQAVQTVVGMVFASFEDADMVGKDEYNMAVWAQRLRLFQQTIPSILGLVGIDARTLARSLSTSSPTIAAVLSGGNYSQQIKPQSGLSGLGFVQWEITAAHAIYFYVVPALQFGLAIVIVDTWQYFLHRAMHMNKWLYTTFHSRHHRLYVPYAYGALYNHPFEGFLLDTIGTALAYTAAGLSTRQALWFFTCTTIKTVDDHCGYAFPWDPLQHITSNNAGYHDVHHQSWGIKTNFSQPFFTFWDRLLGTKWSGGDVSARYERARRAAEYKLQQDKSRAVTGSVAAESAQNYVTPYAQDVVKTGAIDKSIQSRLLPSIPSGKASAQALASREQVAQDHAGGGVSVLAEETIEEIEARAFMRRSSPRKRSTTQSSSGSFKGLRERVATTSGVFHGRTGGVLGYESTL